ncbi:conjugal transfer protein MobC [Sphingobacterium humi]|uniref:Type IV secretion system DNA-binding domain-containing protein n=1 Tax=Sphingobacterium humi TaxID=1796905 RepID=A0A6N8L274_9SPHI|nr:conjugal transfer protein MobC [Sphingobacterium humi]MVZ63820.1 type IV secretion system DNA-binding domain-containing protein [Sphingobacterium humi]
MNTGENIEALRKISDLCRVLAFTLLILHILFLLEGALQFRVFDSPFVNRLLQTLLHTTVFRTYHLSKLMALVFLLLSLIGTKGKKEKKFKTTPALICGLVGLFLYFLNSIIWVIAIPHLVQFVTYASTCFLGFLLIIRGFAHISRVIGQNLLEKDIFNRKNQTFPQQEELLSNEYSINLPCIYQLKGKYRKSWINIINPFRALLVLGSPGSGKSYFVIRHVISQHIKKGFSMFVYDFKYDDLTRIAYHHWRISKQQGNSNSRFFCINFDDLRRTNRCNPLEPSAMSDISDAAESARTILLGLNRDWIKRQGDFFIESSINLLTAVIWYLRKYQDGEFCTLPHVIELMQQDYDKLFSLLRSNKEIEVLINPFVNAYMNNVMEQLEGQVASAKIALARISSPQLYFVLSGNDFDLDINNPEDPKIVCMGNNPQKIQIYGAVLSLFVNRLIKQVNRKGMQKCSLVFDEFPTIYLNNIDSLIATARSNKVATCLGVQDISQLRKDYGRDLADVIMNIVGNIISGQVSGETARQLSERIGKIMQDRESLSVNDSGTSVSYSQQLEMAIPASTISGLSSGEFVGVVADDPLTPIELKCFNAKILNDHSALQSEESSYKPLQIINNIDESFIIENYLQIKKEVLEITFAEIDRLLSDPELQHLVLRKD